MWFYIRWPGRNPGQLFGASAIIDSLVWQNGRQNEDNSDQIKLLLENKQRNTTQ